MPNTANELSGRVGLETTDFKTGLAEMNRELRVLESSFRASAAGLGDWSKDASGLEMRIRSLTSQIEVQKSKVAALEAEYQRVAEEKGANSRAAQELQIKLNKETETLGKMESELGKTEGSLSEMRKETDKLEKEEGQATTQTNKFAGALNGLKDKLGAGISGIGKMAVGVGKLAGGLAIGLVAGAGAAAAGLGTFLVKTAATADELVETAEKIGISTDRLQELNYIAEQTGTGVDTMQGAMSRMIRSLDDAEKVGTPAADAFGKLGISIRDSSGNLRDSEAIFFDAVAALGGIANETERDALAMDLFGKSALELNPLINLGKDGMAAMSAEASKLGAVMGEETVYGMAELNDKIAGVKAGFMGLAGELISNLLPVGNKVVEWISGSLIPWLQDNLPKAIQILSNFWFYTLKPAMEQVYQWMSTVLFPFLVNEVYPWLQENIPRALQFLSNVWQNVLKPAITAVWNWMSTVLIPFLQNVVAPWLEKNIPAAIEVLRKAWEEVLLPAITAVWDFINTYLVPILKDINDIIGIAFGLAVDAFKAAWDLYLKPAFNELKDLVNDYVIPALTWLMDKVVNPLTTALNTGLKNALQWVVDKLDDLKQTLANMHLPDWLTPGSPTPFELGIQGINAALRELDKYDLPGIDRGLSRIVSPGNTGNGTVNNWSLTINEAGNRGNVMMDFALMKALART